MKFAEIKTEGFRDTLSQKVYDAAVGTVKELFKCDLVRNPEAQGRTPEVKKTELAVRVKMLQGLDGIMLRLVFDRYFLSSLISEIYDENTYMEQAEACSDAACELANIICNQVKAYLNKQGFFLVMDFPYVETPADADIRTDKRLVMLDLTLGARAEEARAILSIDAGFV